MRPLLLLSSLLITAACTNAPTASPPETPDAPDAPDAPQTAPGADARCPAPTEACMNEDNHAQCLDVAATCSGEIVQLESCPLQFACSTDSAKSTGGDPDAPVSNEPTEAGYQPCAGKSCGDECSVCAPDDPDCVETAVVKVCDQHGKCSGLNPKCE